MDDKFIIDNIEYKIISNPHTNGPMVVRTDGSLILNRAEVCRKFLLSHGWEESMVIGKNTNTLERYVNSIVNNKKTITKKESLQIIRCSKTKKKINIPSPTNEEVEYWLDSWNKLNDYVAQEEAIDKLFFGEFNSNDNLQNILIKCSVLNDFYSTNIFKIYPVAKHILELNIDMRLKENDPTLVNDIAKIKIGNKHKNFYSFASKYCSHHNPEEYPIYDSYVHKVLMYYKKIDNFDTFVEKDLKSYSKFKNILINFKNFYKLEKYNLKELDRFLWQFGKKYFPKTY